MMGRLGSSGTSDLHLNIMRMCWHAMQAMHDNTLTVKHADQAVGWIMNTVPRSVGWMPCIAVQVATKDAVLNTLSAQHKHHRFAGSLDQTSQFNRCCLFRLFRCHVGLGPLD